MALITFGGWVGSAFVDKLVEKICGLLGNRYERKTDDNSKNNLLKKLQKDMTKVNFVVSKTKWMKKWRLMDMMGDVREAFYDAENILDLFAYRDLQSKHEVCDSISSSASLGPHEDMRELTRVGDKFSEIVKNLPIYLEALKLEKKPKETKDWRQTTSIINEPTFLGRTREKNHLKVLLKDINEEDLLNYRVVALFGIGGIGKTTLAQSIYNDQEVMDHFDLKQWIYVSEKFDVKKLTIEIIQSISKKKYKGLRYNNLDYLQELLRKKLYNKRFLIVLDDVWNEIRSNWETLSKPFKYAKPGSKIIVTTRSKNVSALMGTKEVIELNGLDEENYWQLFSQCTFGDQNPKNYPKLQNLGKQIVKKLGGSPLAAKTIGGALKSKLEEDHWRETLKSRLWQVEQKADDIFPALKLSFEHLPKHLQQCFAYCAVFPKDYLFEKETLIKIWIAHDFIQPRNSSKTLEDVGGDYFNELLNWSFFQNAVGSADRYVIPNLLHDIAESVSNCEYFRIEDDFHVTIPKRVKHLYTTMKNMLKILLDESNELMKLRSLIVHYEPGSPWLNSCEVLQETIKRVKGLRVLILPNIPGILTTSINHLVHLRYLDVQYKTITDLENSIFKLFHLRFLNLDVEQKTQIPLLKEMIKLTKLRYLNAPQEIIRNIPSIGGLSYLQELREFEIREENGFDLGQLKEMRDLKGALCINKLEKARTTEDSKLAELENKDKIKSLSLNWSTKVEMETEIGFEEHENVLEGLCPNPNLQNLQITRYMGTKSPTWLKYTSLPNLEQIKLFKCKHWEIIPPFGELPYLKILHLSSINGVKYLGSDFYGKEKKVFPQLEELLMEELEELKEWSEAQTDQEFFPRLKKLTILKCNKLKGPLPLPIMHNKIQIRVLENPNLNPSNDPPYTSSNFELIIDRIWFLHKCIPQNCIDSIQTMDINSYLLKNFTDEQEKWFGRLKSLQKLRFWFCTNLNGLPSSLKSITALESLHLEKCLKLKFFNDLPISLNELEIKKCNKSLARHCKPGSGKNWPKISHVRKIMIDGKDFREEIQRGNYYSG